MSDESSPSPPIKAPKVDVVRLLRVYLVSAYSWEKTSFLEVRSKADAVLFGSPVSVLAPRATPRNDIWENLDSH